MGTTLDITKTQKGGTRIWFSLAVTATGSYLTIGAGGVPDATENPLAKLVGFTEKGSMNELKKSITEEYYDEQKFAVDRSIDQVSGSIKADAAQVMDSDLITLALNGIGTPLTPTGKLAWSLGESALAYTAVAAITATKNDITKFEVFMLYKAYNKADYSTERSRVTRAKIPLDFEGVAIATRPSTDSFGQLYITTV